MTWNSNRIKRISLKIINIDKRIKRIKIITNKNDFREIKSRQGTINFRETLVKNQNKNKYIEEIKEDIKK